MVKVEHAMTTFLQADHIECISRELRCAMSEQNAHKHEWSESLRTWIANVCKLSWQMAVQQPQMIFDTPRINEPIDIENDKIFPVRNMNFSKGMVISYYLEPNLMHGDTLLERGRVVPRCVIVEEPDEPNVISNEYKTSTSIPDKTMQGKTGLDKDISSNTYSHRRHDSKMHSGVDSGSEETFCMVDRDTSVLNEFFSNSTEKKNR